MALLGACMGYRAGLQSLGWVANCLPDLNLQEDCLLRNVGCSLFTGLSLLLRYCCHGWNLTVSFWKIGNGLLWIESDLISYSPAVPEWERRAAELPALQSLGGSMESKWGDWFLLCNWTDVWSICCRADASSEDSRTSSSLLVCIWHLVVTGWVFCCLCAAGSLVVRAVIRSYCIRNCQSRLWSLLAWMENHLTFNCCMVCTVGLHFTKQT